MPLTDEELFGGPSQLTPLSDEELFGPVAQPAAPAPANLAPEFKDFVKQQEGYTPTPKWDVKQYSTGFGTRYRPGDPVGDKAFDERRLDEELTKAASLVDRFKPDLPMGVRHALTDLTFNTGTKWQNSGLGQAVLKGDWADAQQRFLQYNKADGEELPGLVNRRKALAQLFTDGTPVAQMSPQTPAFQGGPLSDRELFGPDFAPAPVQASAPASPAYPPEAEPAGTSQTPPPAEVPAASSQVDQPGAFKRGLMNTLLNQNPTQAADALESMARLQPNLAGTLNPIATQLREWAKLSPEEYKPKAKDLFSAVQGGWEELGTFLGEGAGQVVGSAAPSVAGGIGGAAVGGALGSVVPGVGTAAGATVGGVAGGLAPGVLLNWGDAWSTLREEGLDVEAADKAAAWLVGPMTALDYPLVGQVTRAFTREAKKEIVRSVARRILVEGGKGMTKEAVTEALQETLPLAEAARQTGKPLMTVENASRIAGAGVIGAMGGAGAGGVSGVPRPISDGPPAGAEDIAQSHQGLVSREKTAEPTPTPAPTPPPEVDIPFSQPTPAADTSVFARPPEQAGPVFYSKLRQLAEEKLPERASVEQIINTLRGKVKDEEIQALGVEDFLARQTGPVSKKDLISHLEENAIEVQETAYTGTDATFGDYTTRGPARNYQELVLRIPTRIDPGLNYTGPHFADQNIVSHARTTEREDGHGIPVLHVEEIQSDWAQEGARFGFKNETLAERQTWWIGVPGQDRRPSSGPYYSREMAESVARNLGMDVASVREGEKHTIKGGIAPTPFKTSWEELTIKRLIRYAADKGISRITLAPGVEQIRRYPSINRDQQAGLTNSYDFILPSKMKKIIKQLGGTWGETWIDTSNYAQVEPTPVTPEQARVFYIDIPESAATQVRVQGQSMFSIPPNLAAAADPRVYGGRLAEWGPTPIEHTPPAGVVRTNRKPKGRGPDIRFEDPEASKSPMYSDIIKGINAVNSILQKMKLESIVYFTIYDGTKPGSEGVALYGYTKRDSDVKGQRPVNINLQYPQSAIDLYATIAHEVGHAVFFQMLEKADSALQLRIVAAFEKWRETNTNTTPFFDMLVGRDNVISASRFDETQSRNPNFRVWDTMAPGYWLSFEEWSAEQFARWATSGQVPLNAVERFMKGVKDKILELHQKMFEKLGLTYKPEAAVAEWLDSLIKEKYAVGEILRRALERMREISQKILDKIAPQLKAAPPQPELAGARGALRDLFGNDIPQQMKEDAVLADRFNWLYKYGLSLIQVAKRNLHIKELQAYREDVQKMHIEIQNVMAKAHLIMSQLRRLGRRQEEAVYAAMHDLDQMNYRTAKEIADDVQRNPTLQEFDAIVKKHKLSVAGLKALNNMRLLFDAFLGSNEEAARELAARTFKDPAQLMQALKGIQESFRAMRNRPYFPHLQFGELTITVYDAAGKIIHLESVERSGFMSAKQVQERRYRELKAAALPGESVQKSMWEKDVRPMVGMNKALLDIMAEKLDLSDTQRAALDQLRFAAAPTSSFRHRFQKRKNVAGYSMDFRRAFATYFFHGAHFYGKAKYMDRLTDHIKALKATTRAVDVNGQKLYPDTVTRMKIVNFLHDHKQNLLDVKGDWATLRAITFVWSLGYSASAAALNLTQLGVGTFPFLAAAFGDARAVAAMTKAGAQLSTYYSKGRLRDMTDDDLRAMDEAIKDGTITEAMAPQLAAAAQGNNLLTGIGGNLIQRGWQHFMEKSAFLFEMTEQMNRRITFRAAWKLALDNPNSKFVNEAVAANPQKMARLMGPTQQGGLGWTERNARAYIAAKEAVESTQYVYAQYARPRFMRGKLGTIFMFKMFVQNTLFMLWNYPAAAVRSLLVMGFIGGLMGLPGADDVKEIIRVIAWQIFGKDFNLEREARRQIIEMSGGQLPPDLILHGIARRGMGIPAVLDAMGSTAGYGTLDEAWQRFTTGQTRGPGGKPAFPNLVGAPMTDWSKSVGMGQILPVQLGELFGPPNKDESKALADQIQRASGAAFGLWFNIYKAATDAHSEPYDPKRWERAVPRAFASVSRAFRIASEGRERTRTGATLQNFDVHDTEQLAELIAMGLGFQPLASTAQWDRIIAQRETQEFWDVSRGILLEQYSKTLRTGDKDTQAKVWGAIQKFNQDLPEGYGGKRITGEVIRNSMQSRQRTINAQESGVGVGKRSRGVDYDIQQLFPESTVDVRRVR